MTFLNLCKLGGFSPARGFLEMHPAVFFSKNNLIVFEDLILRYMEYSMIMESAVFGIGFMIVQLVL